MNDSQLVHLIVAPTRQILRDTKQNIRAILLVFAALFLYILLSAAAVCRSEESWSYSKALYFTVINVTTVGFGDVVPSGGMSRGIACINAFAGLLFFGVLVALISLAFQPGEYTGTGSLPESARTTVAPRFRQSLDDALSALLTALAAESRRGTPREVWAASEESSSRSQRREYHVHI